MQDQDNKKTKEQLLKEIAELRTQTAELEQWKTERIRLWARVEESSRYAESILETAHDSFLVLDADLKVISANRYFYDTFKVKPEETIGQFIYDLGNQQWDISRLRILLENVLPKSTKFDNYEVEHNFQDIGHVEEIHHQTVLDREDPPVAAGGLATGRERDAVLSRPVDQLDQLLLTAGLYHGIGDRAADHRLDQAG